MVQATYVYTQLIMSRLAVAGACGSTMRAWPGHITHEHYESMVWPSRGRVGALWEHRLAVAGACGSTKWPPMNIRMTHLRVNVQS